MDFAEFAYLIEIIRLHCSPRGYTGKGTARIEIDHEQMATASQQIFLFFPKQIPQTSSERRSLIDQRVREVLSPGYSGEEFKMLGDMIETVFINWNLSKSDRSKRAKYTIGAVRLKHPRIYSEILQAQNHRCVFCGTLFVDGENIHLDHILPYSLGGDDSAGGSNWQLLCPDCNEGKRDLFTVLQYYGRQNWIYSLKNWYPETERRENWKRFRLIVLVRDGECKNCGRGPAQVQLKSINEGSGLSIPSNMVCVCEEYPNC